MMKKLLALLLCFALVATLCLTGCGDKEEKVETNFEKADTEQYNGTSVNYEVEYYEGKEDGPVAIVGDEEVSVEEFEYFLMMGMYTKASESGSQEPPEGFWTEEIINTVMEEALNQAVLTHVYRMVSVDNGVKLSDEDLKAIDDSLAQGAEYYGGEENFDLFFQAQGLTRDLYKELSVRNFYASALYEDYAEKVITDEEIEQVFKKDYVKAKHILIANKDAETGEDVSADAYTKIESVKAQLDKGADFDALIKEYNEDPGMEANPDGYVFTKGEMVAPFEEAAFALEPGQISDIVTTDYGYHIIQKLELTDADLDTATTDAYGNQMTTKEIIRSNLANNSFSNYLEEQKGKYTVKINSTVYDGYKKNAEAMYNEFYKMSTEVSNQLTAVMQEQQAAAEAAAAEAATDEHEGHDHEGHDHE